MNDEATTLVIQKRSAHCPPLAGEVLQFIVSLQLGVDIGLFIIIHPQLVSKNDSTIRPSQRGIMQSLIFIKDMN